MDVLRLPAAKDKYERIRKAKYWFAVRRSGTESPRTQASFRKGVGQVRHPRQQTQASAQNHYCQEGYQDSQNPGTATAIEWRFAEGTQEGDRMASSLGPWLPQRSG
jgi:hypothetical protein